MKLMKAVCLAVWLWTNSALAQTPDMVDIKAYTDYEKDGLFEVLLEFDIKPGWHLFAPYDQEFGAPLVIQWQTPQNALVLEESFSRTKSFNQEGISFDGYEGKAFYKTTIKNIQPTDELLVAISWQGCKDECIRGEKKLRLYPRKTQNFGKILREASSSFLSDDYLPSINLISILLMAFLGGIILNLMPCVLPILSIKIISLANVRKKTRSYEAWFYTLGVVVSMLAVAAVLLILRKTNDAAGWGFQMQSPLFVGIMLAVFVVLALMMLDIINFNYPWLNKLSLLKFKDIKTNAFMSGLLAVLIASPCSAPFMGAAIGYALMAPTYVYFPVFLMLALGYALPFAWLAYHPKMLHRILPKPGKWMNVLKKILSIPIILTCWWLAWILAAQTGLIKNNSPIWEEYSADKVKEALINKRPVFIDFTARWCITCLVNKKAALQSDTLQALAKEKNIILLRADFTDQDKKIADGLKKYGRASVPLYVYYDGKSNEYLILPQILTPQILEEYLQ